MYLVTWRLETIIIIKYKSSLFMMYNIHKLLQITNENNFVQLTNIYKLGIPSS